VFTIKWKPVHDPVETLFTIAWNTQTPGAGGFIEIDTQSHRNPSASQASCRCSINVASRRYIARSEAKSGAATLIVRPRAATAAVAPSV